MSDLVVNIPAVTVTAEKPKLTTKEDFINLKRYADAFRRGEIGQEKIPYKYRVHLPQTQEKAQGIAYQQHKDDEKTQDILKQQGWDKLEKAYGIGMSSLVAAPALSQVAASAVPGWTPPTPPTFNPSNFVPFGQTGGMGTYVLKQFPAMTGGMIGNEIVQGVARRNGYDGFADWVHRGVLKNENKPGFLASMGYEFLNPGNYVGGWAGNRVYNITSQLQGKLPSLRWGADPTKRYRNIGNDLTGIEDLYSSGEVLPPPMSEDLGNGIRLGKTFTKAFFGHKGKLVNPKHYAGKYFVGVEDTGQFYRPHRNQWGFSTKAPVKLESVTINRRILPNLTNGNLYLEFDPKHFYTSTRRLDTSLMPESKNGIVNLYNYYKNARAVRNIPGFDKLGQSRWDSELFSTRYLGEGLHSKVYGTDNFVYKTKFEPIPFRSVENTNIDLGTQMPRISSGQYILPEGFPEVPNLEYVGVRVAPNGNLYPVFKQKRIYGTTFSKIYGKDESLPHIQRSLENLGYKKIGANRYSKKDVVFKDLHGDNAMLGDDGLVYIIDPDNMDVKFNPYFNK